MKMCFRSTVAVIAALLTSAAAHAGTQDFVLVNSSGVVIYELYISETRNDDWEDDVLGEDVFDTGGRLAVSFSGRDACLWDMLAVDGNGNSVTWTSLNLCTSHVIELTCDNDGECYATTE